MSVSGKGLEFENIVIKEEIAQNEIFHFLTKYVHSCLLQNCRMRERVNSVISLGYSMTKYDSTLFKPFPTYNKYDLEYLQKREKSPSKSHSDHKIKLNT